MTEIWAYKDQISDLRSKAEHTITDRKQRSEKNSIIYNCLRFTPTMAILKQKQKREAYDRISPNVIQIARSADKA